VKLRSQRRLASEILKVGIHRVWIDPEYVDEVSMAVRREDIRRLIKDGIIRALPEKGTSTSRAKKLHEQKKKGRRRGHGSRKGRKTARMPRKESWMNRIRAIRRKLRELRDKRIINRRVYRMLYMKAKGGTFGSIRHLLHYIEEHDLARKAILE